MDNRPIFSLGLPDKEEPWGRYFIGIQGKMVQRDKKKMEVEMLFFPVLNGGIFETLPDAIFEQIRPGYRN